ncbi:MAG: type VI secretion system tip protein VgrG [Acidobacteriota bacterium]
MRKEFVVQYNESDLDFLSRQMERYGIFYYFYDDSSGPGGSEKIIFGDHKDAFAYKDNVETLAETTQLTWVPPMKYAPGAEFQVKNFIPRYSMRSAELTLNEFNYRGVQPGGTETGRLTTKADLDTEAGEGSLAFFGAHYENAEDDGRLLCQRQAERLLCDQEYFTGQSDCFELAAGHVFSLKGHFRGSFNNEVDGDGKPTSTPRPYLLTEVTHECSIPAPASDWDETRHGYSANFTAIDAHLEYRPPQITPVPSIPGIITATVDSSDADAERADLDDQGRYLTHFHFDVDREPGAGKWSLRLRMCQPYGGHADRGIHFPLIKGTEVLVAFVNGDIDRPIIMGAVPNPANTSPVTKNQHTRNRLVTSSSITLEMEDGVPDPVGGTRTVAAPPAADEPAGNEEPRIWLAGFGEKDISDNWTRLFLTHRGDLSYLRMGATPSDETGAAQFKPSSCGSKRLLSPIGLNCAAPVSSLGVAPMRR